MCVGCLCTYGAPPVKSTHFPRDARERVMTGARGLLSRRKICGGDYFFR